MDKVTAQKIGEIACLAAQIYVADQSQEYADCVGRAFWKSFGQYEQSPLMQEVYCILCDMGYTPLESHQ